MARFGASYLVPELRVHPCDKEILELQAMLGTALPSDYKVFLSEFGGVWVGASIEFPLLTPSGREVISLEDLYGFYQVNALGRRHLRDLFFMIEVFQDRMPSNLIPIASAFYGNQVCLCVQGENRG